MISFLFLFSICINFTAKYEINKNSTEGGFKPAWCQKSLWCKLLTDSLKFDFLCHTLPETRNYCREHSYEVILECGKISCNIWPLDFYAMPLSTE